MNKEKNLTIRLTESQRDFYKSEAEKYGLNMTDFFKLQNVIFYRLKDLEPETFESLLKESFCDVSRI